MLDRYQKTLDIPVSACITTCTCEGYLEAAYEWFAQDRLPEFYLPPSDSFYIKAAIRERFPDRLPPSVIEVEDMLIEDRLMPPRVLRDGFALRPSRLQWPPRPIRLGPQPFS